MNEPAPAASAVRPAVTSGWDAEVDGLCALPVRVVRPIRWSLDGEAGVVRVQLDRLGKESLLRPTVAPILEGLTAGDALPGLVRRVMEHEPARSQASAARSARNLVAALVAQGNVEIALPPVPSTFAHRYERVRELGRGGVGVAWLAHDSRRGGAPVVVKHAWNWSGSFSTRDGALRGEADAMARVDHPGVVHLLDSFDVDGRFHLVRDFVEGRALTWTVLEDGTPTPPQRARALADAAAILDHLHGRGLLCLDANPSNFLRTPLGGLVLADLGHCRPRDGASAVAVPRRWGTAGYVAPEIARDGRARVESDVYALGALAAFLVTGRRPATDPAAPEALAVLERAGATGGERRLVAACCAADPAARPGTPPSALALL